LEPDPKVQVTALSELGELVGHQNTIYEATAPAAMYVAGILTHPAAMTLRPYRNVPIRATLLNWLVSVAYDASDEIVGHTGQYFPSFLTHNTTMAAFRDLRPMLYRAVAPFLQDSQEDVREAAVIAALILAEHPALAEHRDHLAVRALHPGDKQRRP
jgi:ABC-type transport system involved in cytochrome bd biosynthesis fused ATPase/permease subunit